MVNEKLSNKFQQKHKPVKDKNRNPPTTTNKQLKRWVDHFEELLKRTVSERPPEKQPSYPDPPECLEDTEALWIIRDNCSPNSHHIYHIVRHEMKSYLCWPDDFADDLALLSHNHNQIQDKTTPLATQQELD